MHALTSAFARPAVASCWICRPWPGVPLEDHLLVDHARAALARCRRRTASESGFGGGGGAFFDHHVGVLLELEEEHRHPRDGEQPLAGERLELPDHAGHLALARPAELRPRGERVLVGALVALGVLGRDAPSRPAALRIRARTVGPDRGGGGRLTDCSGVPARAGELSSGARPARRGREGEHERITPVTRARPKCRLSCGRRSSGASRRRRADVSV